MSNIRLVEDFNFIDFLSVKDVYKKYIRPKGNAMLEIVDTSLIDDHQLKIKLDKETISQNKLILIFKVENEIYHIPVLLKETFNKN